MKNNHALPGVQGYGIAALALGIGLAMTGLALLLWPGPTVEPALSPAHPRPSGRPNIVLIVIDALRADRLKAQRNGLPVMPSLASLARAGTLYANAWAPASWTRPSMASLFTALPMETHQVRWSADPDQPDGPSDVLSDAFETLAEYLRAAGWRTIGVQTNPNCLPEFGLAQGFETYAFSAAWRAEQVTDKALELAAGASSPFFLYAHYMEPHLPYPASPEARAAMGWPPPVLLPTELEIVDKGFRDYFWSYLRHRYGMSTTSPPAFSDVQRDATRMIYDAACRTADTAVGRLVYSLERQFPATLFIILADHGEQFWDHDLLGHGLSLYSEETRVPLILYGWRTPRGLRETTPVSLQDVMPLLVDRLGLPPRDHWMGTAPGLPERPVFSSTRAPWPSWNVHLDMVVFGPWKLIHDVRKDTCELYNLEADPGEHRNLCSEAPEVADRGRSLLREHQEMAIFRRQAGQETRQVDESVREQLRAIGYME
ncbi:MAG: sulfatase [Candidatus Hydrogenedentes bacterium]|nr:sulfatase [Candidatus Hydrogenedentota bacterium]